MSTVRNHLDTMVFAVVGRASNYSLYCLGQGKVDVAAALPVAQLSGGLIGGCTNTFISGSNLATGHGSIGELLIYNRGLSEAEVTNVMWAAAFQFDAVPQKRAGNIYVDGTSLDEGARGTDYLSWPEQLNQVMTLPARIINVAVSGGTFATQMGTIPTWLGTVDAAAPTNILVLGGMTNDFSAGRTALQAQADLATYLSMVRTGVAWKRIIVCTVMPRGTFNSNPTTSGAERTAYNTWLIANAGTLGIEVFDWNADPLFANDNVVNNPLWFGDTTHLNADGLGYAATIMRPMLDYALAA